MLGHYCFWLTKWKKAEVKYRENRERVVIEYIVKQEDKSDKEKNEPEIKAKGEEKGVNKGKVER